MAKQTFMAWLKEQKGRNDEVGDLADDVPRDPSFPKRLTAKAVGIKYLKGKTGRPEIVEAFKNAWREYKGK